MKLLAVKILFLFPIIANCLDIETNKTKQKQLGQVNFYYGTSNTIGFIFLGSDRYSFGLDCSLYFGEKGIGKDYSNVFGPNVYPKDIYKINNTPTYSIGLLFGKRIYQKLIVYSKLGFSGESTYYNGYDNQQILSPNGYWYVSQNKGTSPMLGLGMVYNQDRLSFLLGYDNFNKLKLGIGFTFK
jgi:hypothetical protein